MSRKQTDCASTNHNNKTTKSNSKLNQKQKRKKIENGEWFYDENDTLKAKGVWNIFNKLYENDNSFQDTLGAIIVWTKNSECKICKFIVSGPTTQNYRRHIKNMHICNYSFLSPDHQKLIDLGVPALLQEITNSDLKKLTISSTSKPKTHQISQPELFKFHEKCVESMVSIDAANTSIKNPQIIGLLQNCVQIGHEYGNVNISHIVPGYREFNQTVDVLSKQIKKKRIDINKQLNKHPLPATALATDGWTDKITKQGFIEVTQKYNINGTRQKQSLGLHQFEYISLQELRNKKNTNTNTNSKKKKKKDKKK
eukprot:408012_1